MRGNQERAPGHDPYAALRHRDYRLYAAGNFLAGFGGQMQTVAIGWELYERTDSALALGMVGLVQMLPVLLLTLPSGHIADQFDRRRIMMASLSVMALSSLGLAVLSAVHGSILLIYALLMLTGAARALNNPARSSLLPQIVPGEHFSNAITWNSSFGEISAMSGPALGGFVIAWAHRATPAYVLDALCTFAFVLCLAFLRVHHAPRPVEKPTFESLVAGFRFVRGTQVILGSITLDMVGVLLGGATTLLPVYARDILKVGPEGLGWLRACPSVGAFVMAMSIAHLPPMRRAGKTLLCAVAAFGTATIVFGLSRSFGLSMLALVCLGAADNISVVVRHSLIQMRTPDELRGRVSAVNSLFIGSSNELGGFESGLVAYWFGPTVSVVAGGAGTILVVLAAAAIWPQLRNLRTLHEPAG